MPLYNPGGSGAASDATVTFTDITTNNSSTSKHGFLKKLSNSATDYMDGSGAWSVPAGGGTTTYEHLLDVPPGSAHAKDDEFPGSSLDGKWTNPLSSGGGLDLALTVANGWLRLEPNTSGTASTGKHMFGIRQAAPTGSFTISAKVAGNLSNTDDDTSGGIFVARTAATLMHINGRYNNSGGTRYRVIASATYSETADTGGFDGFNSDGGALVWPVFWYRIQWDTGTSTLTFSYSADGFDPWITITTRSSMAQPDRIGIGLYSNTATIRADHALYVKWFRVTEP
jgi:hypothetical protein